MNAAAQPLDPMPDARQSAPSQPDAPTDETTVNITPSGQHVIPKGESVPSEEKEQWVPPGKWKLRWADEFSGRGEIKNWYPMLAYDPVAYQKNTSKGLRWSGSTEESAWMYSTKTGNHVLDGAGHLVMRIVCDKTKSNEHGPRVNAAYLMSGYPKAWDKTEPQNTKWGGRFFSPAKTPLYVSASVRTDKMLGYSTWFAFWLFSETRAYNGQPADGTEIDMVEIVKGQPPYMSHCFNVANHWKDGGGSESKQFNAASRPRPQAYVDCNDAHFHTYGIEWSQDAMKCFVDGKHYYTFTENIPSDPVDMMILLTLEFKLNAWDPHQGDGRTEGPFVSENLKTREMSRVLVDYVRVYEKQTP